MKISVHQPNLVPHFGFFYKMSQSDLFILLSQCQFEKNGYQNRFFIQSTGKWITKPVCHGLEPLYKKQYVDGNNLTRMNTDFILWMRDLLSIDTRVVPDIATSSTSTQRLIDNLNHYGATVYVTHPSAKDKYLDEKLIRGAGIDIEYSDHRLAKFNILELLLEHGIEGVQAQLYKKPQIKVVQSG